MRERLEQFKGAWVEAVGFAMLTVIVVHMVWR